MKNHTQQNMSQQISDTQKVNDILARRIVSLEHVRIEAMRLYGHVEGFPTEVTAYRHPNGYEVSRAAEKVIQLHEILTTLYEAQITLEQWELDEPQDYVAEELDSICSSHVGFKWQVIQELQNELFLSQMIEYKPPSSEESIQKIQNDCRQLRQAFHAEPDLAFESSTLRLYEAQNPLMGEALFSVEQVQLMGSFFDALGGYEQAISSERVDLCNKFIQYLAIVEHSTPNLTAFDQTPELEWSM